MGFDLYLSKQDINTSQKMIQQVLSLLDEDMSTTSLSLKAIEKILHDNPLAESCSEFGPMYVGSILAKKSKNSRTLKLGIQILRKNNTSENPYCQLLANYLERHGSLTPPTTVFSSVTPFDAWKKSDIYSSHMRGIVDQTVKFAHHFPCQNSLPTIVDVGTGSGVLAALVVNQLARDTGLKSLRLILNDQSPAMLKNAEAHCRENISIPVEIVTLESRIENLETQDLNLSTHNETPWFILASASVHHMPKDDKIKTLRILGEWAPHLLIGEFNANNDLPEPNSPELFYSVSGSYGYLFKDFLAGLATKAEKTATIEHFLLAESINILRSEKKHGSTEEGGRVDYHTTSEEWIDVAQKAGLKTQVHQTLVRIPNGRPVTYFLHFRRNDEPIL